MLRLPVFFSLLGSTAAVDIWLSWFSGGTSVHCVGMNPDKCCGISGSSDSPFWGVSFQAIPPEWNLWVRGHAGPLCGAIVESATSRGRQNVDMGQGPFGGGGYSFVPWTKRSESEGDLEFNCTEVVRPSVMTLPDGVQYNIAELDDAAFAEMVRVSLLSLRICVRGLILMVRFYS